MVSQFKKGESGTILEGSQGLQIAHGALSGPVSVLARGLRPSTQKSIFFIIFDPSFSLPFKSIGETQKQDRFQPHTQPYLKCLESSYGPQTLNKYLQCWNAVLSNNIRTRNEQQKSSRSELRKRFSSENV